MPDWIADYVWPATVALLGVELASPNALALLLAIGWQESRWRSRRQSGGGPARGFWQFELAGVEAVLRHQASGDRARGMLRTLGYRAPQPETVLAAIEHNDVVALAFGRLLLWTLPRRLPNANECEEGWSQYVDAWRPGRPRRETWDAAWVLGWSRVRGVP